MLGSSLSPYSSLGYYFAYPSNYDIIHLNTLNVIWNQCPHIELLPLHFQHATINPFNSSMNLFCSWTFKNITIMAIEPLGYSIVFTFLWEISLRKIWDPAYTMLLFKCPLHKQSRKTSPSMLYRYFCDCSEVINGLNVEVKIIMPYRKVYASVKTTCAKAKIKQASALTR